MKVIGPMKGMFCVADLLFETAKNFLDFQVEFDETFINDFIRKV